MSQPLSRPPLSRRVLVLAVCAALLAALLAVAALAPLPFVVLQPGITADTLGGYRGQQIIQITGKRVRRTTGELRLTTIGATPPDASVGAVAALEAWPDPTLAVVPRAAVYPAGESVRQVERKNAEDMRRSQHAATAAALRYLGLSPSAVRVRLRLADVGGPSAGLMFTLGVIDKLAGNGRGGDLTGGRIVAGTGTISTDGTVGEVGGVALKTQAAAAAHATVFLVPRAECQDARAGTPAGLRLVPVRTLTDAVRALDALDRGGAVPSC